MDIRKDCHTCDYRHGCCIHDIPEEGECGDWKLGRCYTCKFVDANEEEWYRRGCEAEYPGGCTKYKRSWKKTFELLRTPIGEE